MPSKGNLAWHPPFSGVKSRFYSYYNPNRHGECRISCIFLSPFALLSYYPIIHVYNFPLSDIMPYGILEYRKHLTVL